MSRIELNQFRSHHRAKFTFSPEVTIISGPNGSGKTNLLEAIYVLATGSSFRDSDEYLTEYDHNWWKIEGVIDDEMREVRYQTSGKQIRMRDKIVRRISPQARLPVVLFEPDDLYMIHGSPMGRRRYIDKQIASVTMGYATTLRRYERIVAQRNSLLRAPQLDTDTLFVLDIMLSEHAENIITARQEIIDAWNTDLRNYYSQIAASDTPIRVVYHCNVPIKHYKQSLITTLRHHYDHDRLTGTTSAGPHRDDIEFFLDTKPFISTASRGEVRSLVLALKWHEANMVSIYRGAPPIILYDDVLSELDSTRQATLVSYTPKNQVILTTTSSIPFSDRHYTIRL